MRFTLITLLALVSLAGAELTADEILQAVDDNMVYETITCDTEMVIITPEGETRTKLLTMIAEGEEVGLSTVTYPPREAGTKQLRLDDELWLYIPAEDKVLKLTGNMLQRSMLGSDFSYEDMMSRSELTEDYDATLLGIEEQRGRDCYVLELEAVSRDVTYRKRNIWIDTEFLVPLRQELYAASGTLLKIQTYGGLAEYSGRWYPTVIVMRDVVRGSGKTTITMSNLVFDVDIPEGTFSKSNLR